MRATRCLCLSAWGCRSVTPTAKGLTPPFPPLHPHMLGLSTALRAPRQVFQVPPVCSRLAPRTHSPEPRTWMRNGGNLPASLVPQCSRDTSGQMPHAAKYLPSRSLAACRAPCSGRAGIREAAAQAATSPGARGTAWDVWLAGPCLQGKSKKASPAAAKPARERRKRVPETDSCSCT